MPRRRVIIKKQEVEKFVIGQIMGGLGNQLFILFTTIAYALENNMEYYIVDIERVRKTYFNKNGKEGLYKNVKINNKSLPSLRVFKENGFRYQNIPKMDRLVLYGYFQSYKYFDKYTDEIVNILDLFSFRKELEGYDGYLHFRIGDYKNIECHPICDINYYIESFNDIEKRDQGKLKFVYYFEETDRKEVEEKVDILREKFKRFTFEAIDTSLEDYQQMLSMTTLKYCVIANSTFSWWGAYLNQRNDKVVYHPKKWFVGSLGHYDITDLIPNSFKKNRRNAYILTLDKRSDRAIFSKNILEKIGFNVIFFEAIRDQYPVISHRKSMYAIYEKIIKEETNKYCYVFEDDINTLIDIDLDYIINYEELNEDIVYLGCCYNNGKLIKTDKKINDKGLYKISGGVRGLHSMMITKEGAQILKDIFDKNVETILMDVLLEKYTLENPLYIIRDDLVSPCHPKHFGIFFQDRRKFKSDLENCKYY